MWLVGVVVRRYIDFLKLLIPTPLVLVLFCSSIPISFFILKMFFCSLRRIIRKLVEESQIKNFYFTWRIHKLRYYGDILRSFNWKSAVQYDVGV